LKLEGKNFGGNFWFFFRRSWGSTKFIDNHLHFFIFFIFFFFIVKESLEATALPRRWPRIKQQNAIEGFEVERVGIAQILWQRGFEKIDTSSETNSNWSCCQKEKIKGILWRCKNALMKSSPNYKIIFGTGRGLYVSCN
jgi:hypothetical protein